MGITELITAGITIARLAPQAWETIKLWVDAGHEPTAQEIADLEQKHYLQSGRLRHIIANAKARENNNN